MADEIQGAKLYPLLSPGKVRPVKQRNATMQQRRFSQDLHEEEEGERGEGREEGDESVRVEIRRNAEDRSDERRGEHHQDERGPAIAADAPDADQGKRIDILV